MTSDLDSISSGDQISAIKKELDEALNGFSLLSDRVKQDKNQNIKDMISYFGNLTKNIEDRRIHLADVAWQSLAISFTALGIILAVHILAIFKIPIFLVLFTLLLMSVLKIQEYQVQSYFRYPFLAYPEYANRWKWFYYGNPFLSKINDNPFTAKKHHLDDEVKYLNALNVFAKNYSAETIDKELHDNLLQLFLLQTHNFYKNRFYLRLLKYDLLMPRILIWLLLIYCAILAIILLFVPVASHFLLTWVF